MNAPAYDTIALEVGNRVARLWLNRPEIHNAFNATMIRELRDALRAAAADDAVRVVVLSGRGASFCAGADLNWMREIVRFSYEQNIEESLAIAEFHEELYALPKPTIARVNGPAIGGGIGFLSACDIAVASAGAKFGLSEVKIGLVPAAISPYVVRKIGESRARRYFLTGERIDARTAQEIGLVNVVVEPDELDRKTDEFIGLLLDSGPEALRKAKELLRCIQGMSPEEARTYSARMIAGLRIGREGQEGMAAFLEKRKPKWTL
jgi:methylglutaconyl-CoA hydratase